MKTKKLLVATHNKTKFIQIKNLLKNIPYEIISLTDLGITHDVEETGTTLEQNAILKAKTYCQMTQLPTIADDSGLEVDALNGEPGVYSKRYAGEDATDDQKRNFLLKKMDGVPEGSRDAAFSSAIALAWPLGSIKCFFGKMDGYISLEERGTPIPQFPYCSIFVDKKTDKAITELADEGYVVASNHRMQAIEQLVKELA